MRGLFLFCGVFSFVIFRLVTNFSNYLLNTFASGLYILMQRSGDRDRLFLRQTIIFKVHIRKCFGEILSPFFGERIAACLHTG